MPARSASYRPGKTLPTTPGNKLRGQGVNVGEAFRRCLDGVALALLFGGRLERLVSSHLLGSSCRDQLQEKVDAPGSALRRNSAGCHVGKQALDQVEVVRAAWSASKHRTREARMLEQDRTVRQQRPLNPCRPAPRSRRTDGLTQQSVQNRAVQLGDVAHVHIQRRRPRIELLRKTTHRHALQALVLHQPQRRVNDAPARQRGLRRPLTTTHGARLRRIHTSHCAEHVRYEQVRRRTVMQSSAVSRTVLP